MAERKNAKALACSSLQERTHGNLDVPLQGTSAPHRLGAGTPRLSHQTQGLRHVECPSEPRWTRQTQAEPALGALSVA